MPSMPSEGRVFRDKLGRLPESMANIVRQKHVMLPAKSSLRDVAEAWNQLARAHGGRTDGLLGYVDHELVDAADKKWRVIRIIQDGDESRIAAREITPTAPDPKASVSKPLPAEIGPSAPVAPTYYDASSDTYRPITQEHVDDWQRNLQAHAMFRTGLIALQNACDAVARGEVAVWSVRDLINQAIRDMPQKAD